MSRRTPAPFGRRAVPVTANDSVGAYRLIRVLDCEGPANPRPGQFYMLATRTGWRAGEDERPYLPRAFSFARVRPAEAARDGRRPASGAQLEFLLEAVGPGTERLGSAAPGEELWVTGPLGVGFSAPTRARAAILVAGGIGVAPILCWHDELGPEARLLLGFRTRAHAEAAGLFRGEAELATDDGSAGRRALVTELLREELDRSGAGGETMVYACGPPAMLEAVRAICTEREVPGELALESGMACGFGACFGCVVPTEAGYLRLCVDGPVLRAAALDPGAGSDPVAGADRGHR